MVSVAVQPERHAYWAAKTEEGQRQIGVKSSKLPRCTTAHRLPRALFPRALLDALLDKSVCSAVPSTRVACECSRMRTNGFLLNLSPSLLQLSPAQNVTPKGL
jgi:hypothetical protein